jgi:hypothetical protein
MDQLAAVQAIADLLPSIISLPTPPSTKNTRSRHTHTHENLNAGLPTPSTSTRKPQTTTAKHDHRASPIVRSRHIGTDGVNLEAEAGEDSGSSGSEEDASTATVVTEKRWLGRRGTRRAGLTFAQQMGLLVAGTATETHQAPTSNMEWQSTDGRTAGEPVEKSFYFNAASVTKRELFLESGHRAAIVPENASGNPFLDESDLASTKIGPAAGRSISTVRKTASGRLLDPVDLVIASSSSTSIESQVRPHEPSSPLEALDSLSEDASSETEKEEMDDEEEDDSPYLIEDGATSTSHAVTSERVDTLVIAEEMHDSADELSSSGEMTDGEEDELESAAMELDEGRSSPVVLETRSKEDRRPSITRYLSAIKSSASLSDSEKTPLETPAISDRHVVRRRRSRSRERKTWGKPILGDTDDNPFLASSSIGKPKGESGSWLRTDNARARRSEGEKPTIDYLL